MRMDSFLERLPVTADGDLMLGAGVAYQRDMTAQIKYDGRYLSKIASYDRRIAANVNAGRVALVARHAGDGASLLDWGAGDGSFLFAAGSWGFDAKGFDVIRVAADSLLSIGMFDDDPALFDVVTAWDVIEHMEDPGLFLRRIARGALLCCSVPIFTDLSAVRSSKHYRPGEHLLYFTDDGFVSWMAQYGFRLLERSDHETRAGRDSIGAFAFRRDGR
jgi:hypothetical protein